MLIKHGKKSISKRAIIGFDHGLPCRVKNMALGPQLRQKPRPSASVFVYWVPRAMFFTRHGRPWSNPTPQVVVTTYANSTVSFNRFETVRLDGSVVDIIRGGTSYQVKNLLSQNTSQVYYTSSLSRCIYQQDNWRIILAETINYLTAIDHLASTSHVESPFLSSRFRFRELSFLIISHIFSLLGIFLVFPYRVRPRCAIKSALHYISTYSRKTAVKKTIVLLDIHLSYAQHKSLHSVVCKT